MVSHYEQMASNILKRAVALRVPGLVLEFELLPAMTDTPPAWGADITALLHRHLAKAHAEHGLKCALRVTPTDIRDQARPPVLRVGEPWEKLNRSIDLCIQAGADIISIESVGGKESMTRPSFTATQRYRVRPRRAGTRDMAWLWQKITPMCSQQANDFGRRHGLRLCEHGHAAARTSEDAPRSIGRRGPGDERGQEPCGIRTGAVGPSKDCAYEGP